jgi:hypothetical protein
MTNKQTHRAGHAQFVHREQISSPPPAPATYSNADAARGTELTNRAAAYGAVTPTDSRHAADLADCAIKATDEAKRVSGLPRGLQQPK